MSTEQDNAAGLGKWLPGFDFFQGLTKTATGAIPGLSGLSQWITPTLNEEELEKRIQELKSVQFWLEQNSRALSSTIQALEVQKMTLSTLKGMNVNFADVAQSFAAKPAASAATATSPKRAPAKKASASSAKSTAKSAAAPQVPTIDPLQMWNALAQQFQTIASTAMQDAVTKTAVDMTKSVATGVAKEVMKSATQTAAQAAGHVAGQAVKTVRKAVRK